MREIRALANWSLDLADLAPAGLAKPDPISGDDKKLIKAPIYFLLLAVLLIAVSGAFLDGLAALALLALGGGMFIATIVVQLVGGFGRRGASRAGTHVEALIASDPALTVMTDNEGNLHCMNRVAQQRFGDPVSGARISECLKAILANPGGVVYRLQKAALERGAASDLVTTRSGHVTISVHRVGDDILCWRVEETQQTQGETGESGLLPRITVGRGGTILFMNGAARKLFGKRVTSLDRVTTSTLVNGQVSLLDGVDGKINCLVSQIEVSGGRREIFFLPPPAGDTMVNTSGFDGVPVPLLKLSHNGVVIRANSEALRLLSQEDVQGKRLSDLMEGLGRPVTDWLADAAAGRVQSHSEFLRISRDDREVFVQVVLNRVIESGAPTLVAVLNDATELKTLEAQFVQSQKMQAIGQLAGGVAHDFNNLLTAISGHCDLLLLRHDQGDPDYSDLVQINQNANRAAALVGQLLAFSRKQTLRPEILDLRETLSDLTHLLNRLVGERVSLTLEHDASLRTIRADKRQLEQVLMNLVVNARDAMEGGGEIKVSTEELTLTSPLKRDRAVVAPGEYVLVKVQDEGCGISPDKLQKVFEPFYTTKRTGEGTGLGLSTVYGIVKQTGGFIFVDSVVGQGSCFSLLFPIHTEIVAKPREFSAPNSDIVSQETDAVILLVEDEAPVRAFASRALRMRGFKVLEAESAEAALTLLEDASVEVDVFVTDVVMPGLDGPSWVKKALETRPDVKVVFVSGYAEESFHDDQTDIPNSTFLPKPFSLVELTETVQRQLH